MPLIYLEQYGSLTARLEYRRILRTDAGRLGQLAALLKAEGIWDRIKVTQNRYLSAGLQALECITPSDDRTTLSVLVTYAVDHYS